MAEIQIEQNAPAEEKTQKIEKIGWIVLYVFLGLAFLGLFGKGPVSTAIQNTNDNKLKIESQRFERQGSPTLYRLNISSEATASTTEIAIDNRLLDAIAIQNITPTPQFSRTEKDKTFFTFQTTEKQEANIVINAQTKRAGFFNGEIAITNGPALKIWQLIYP